MTARPKAAHTWARDRFDWYVEPQDCTAALLRAERFPGPVWDPCCGGGNVRVALGEADYATRATDRVGRGGFCEQEVDFLETLWREPLHGARSIVSNPPFYRGEGAEDFIRKALAIPGLEKLAAFVDVRFLGGGGRAAGLYAEHPPSRIWWLTSRPSCPPGAHLQAGGRAQGGTPEFCWLVWDLAAPAAAPTFGWLRRVA